jgi:hypothetical protein
MEQHSFNRSVTVVVPSGPIAKAVEAALDGETRLYFVGDEAEPSQVLADRMVVVSQGSLEEGRWCKNDANHVVVGLLKEAHEKLGIAGEGKEGLWITRSDGCAPWMARLPRTRFVGCLENNADHEAGSAPRSQCKAVHLRREVKSIPQLRWPVVANAMGMNERSAAMESILEWVGAVLVGATALVTPELRGNQMAPLFCTYQVPGIEQCETLLKDSVCITWSGMLHSTTCAHILRVLRSTLGDDGGDWALFSVSGFPEALLGWGQVEHRPSWFGDHRSTMYSLFLNKDSYFGFVTGDDKVLPL